MRVSGLDGWDPARTAFLAMDCQNDICHEQGAYTGPIAAQIAQSGIWPAIRRCLDAARAAGVLVAHVRHLADPWPATDAQETSRVLRGIRRS